MILPHGRHEPTLHRWPGLRSDLSQAELRAPHMCWNSSSGTPCAPRFRLVAAASAGYAVLLVLLTLQALAGIPVTEPLAFLG